MTSFTSGVEFIKGIVSELEERISEGAINIHDLAHQSYAMKQSLQTIIDTNSFMLMTINRCIDYAKATKGIKLVPRLETIDLWETMQLPLTCMRNVQDRVSIVMQSMPSEVCSHVITDKQWLQENLLCLLSNAVKYTSQGNVTVTMSLIDSSTLSFVTENSSKINRNVTSNESLYGKPFQSSLVGKQVPLIASSPEQDSKVVLPRALSINGTAIMLRTGDDDVSARIDADNDGVSARSTSSQDSLYSTKPTQYLLYEIEDNGIGVPPELMDSLFRPFKQTQRLAGGTGLGLYSLAKRIEAIHGEYGVRGRKDGKKGSVFWFTIPYRPDEVTAAAMVAASDEYVPGDISALRVATGTNTGKKSYAVTTGDAISTIGKSLALHSPTNHSHHQTNKKLVESIRQSFTSGHDRDIQHFRDAFSKAGVLPHSLQPRSGQSSPTSIMRRITGSPTNTNAARQDIVLAPSLLLSEQELKLVDVSDSTGNSSPTNRVLPFTHPSQPHVATTKPIATTGTSTAHSTGTHTHNSNGAGAKSTGNHLHLLLVDDSLAIVKMTTMMLKKLGHTVVTADNGEVAISTIQHYWYDKQQLFDIVLMDLQMPVLDGLEATRRLRMIEKGEKYGNKESILPKQTIVGVSANSDYDTVKAAYAAGIDGFLAKPFTVDAFMKTVQSILDKQQQNSHMPLNK